MIRHHISLFGLSLTVFLLAVALSSCASRRTVATLNDVETYIQQRPDSALATIRAIDTTTLTTRSLRAHYALLHAMALDKNWIDTTDVGVVMPAVEYYDRHPSDICRAKAWYYLGRIQQNAGDRPEAIISFMKAERYAEASKDVDFKGLICLAISTIYSQTHLHDEALEYTERAYSLFVEAKDTSNANSALLCMANDYYNLERYSEADSLYRDLIKNGDVYSNLRSSLQCGYALSLVKPKEDYEQAVRVFEEVITSTGRLRNRNTWGAYAYSLLRVGREKQAEQIFKQLEAKQGDAFLSYSYWKSLADAYVGDFASAYRLQNKAFEIQDENVVIALKQSTIKAQKDFLEQVNLESERLAKKQHFIAWGSIALLLAIIIVLLILFRLRKDRSIQEKEQLVDAYKSLSKEYIVLNSNCSELSAQVNQLEKEKSFVREEYIQLCQSHFSKIGRINEVLYYHAEDRDNELYKELKRAIRSIGMDDKNLNEFEMLLNETFDNVMAHFREAFPNKKPRYYRLVSYLFAGYDSSTICAIIPGYQKHNVYVERHRLKQLIVHSDSQYKEVFLRMLS